MILFSHKSYIVVPSDASDVDISRLDSLCIICGIGLIFFDAANPENPNYQIKTRAVLGHPDMFYLKRNVAEIADELLPHM